MSLLYSVYNCATYALILGPVIGEVTQTSAIILVEVEFKDAENPTLQCQLFAKVIYNTSI